MENVHKASKGGLFLGIRGKQLMVALVALLGALLLMLAWEGSPIPAALLPQSLHGSAVPYLLQEGGSNFSTIAGSADLKTGKSEVVVVSGVEDEGDTRVKDLEPAISSRIGGSSKTKSTREGVEAGIQIDAHSVHEHKSKKQGRKGKKGRRDEDGKKGSENTSLQELGRQETRREDGKAEVSILARNAEKLPVCDFSSGDWVEDDTRPLYSGGTCNRKWLSFMWACRIYERPDFGYEKYRWQPHGCNLPAFDAMEFLNRMRNQVLAFVGDSLGRQQFQSMICLLTGGGERADPKDVGSEFGFAKQSRYVKPAGWAYRFQATNTTVLFYWSVCLCRIDPIDTDPEHHFKMHLDRPVSFLRDHLFKFDVLVINTGHHWNRAKIDGNKWIMYRNGKSVVENRFTVGDAYKFTAEAIVHWLSKQISKTGKPRVYMRTLSPRHFTNGDWNTGGTCDNLKTTMDLKDVVNRPTTDPVAEDAVAGTNVRLLNITFLSQFRGEAHVSKFGANNKFQDCLHWCLPGVPDVWNEVLAAEISQNPITASEQG